MTRTTRLVILIAAFCVGSIQFASAQVTWQPTPEPTVSAENEAWFRTGEPIIFLDADYYRAGATVHFNRYQMVRTGSYHGIPIYVDSTQDPFTIFIPIGHGLMQPYERRRDGQLAGTTGLRAPSFPTAIAAESYVERSAATPAPSTGSLEEMPTAIPMTGRSIVEAPRETAGSAVRPKGINGVWITYEGQQWFSVGKAVRMGSGFTEVGSYRGFPVYRRANDADTIYVPTADGMAAPYSTKRPTNSVGQKR
jgi:hypothetical protein